MYVYAPPASIPTPKATNICSAVSLADIYSSLSSDVPQTSCVAISTDSNVHVYIHIYTASYNNNCYESSELCICIYVYS